MTRSEILQVAKPILFNTEMVRAILDGRKTVTRRVIKDKDITNRFDIDSDGSVIAYTDPLTGDHYPPFYPCRYKPGDYLYVRETWERFQCVNCDGDETSRCFNDPDNREGCYVYRASHFINGDARWRPSIHMPKEAARIFLRVTDVRVERLNDMDYMDAICEGIEPQLGEDGYPDYNPMIDFIYLWDSAIPPKDRDKYGWAANPWVFVIEFERVEVTE